MNKFQRVVSFYGEQYRINWYHRICDVIDGVSPKPMSF
jgi:hypothetical protein